MWLPVTVPQVRLRATRVPACSLALGPFGAQWRDGCSSARAGGPRSVARPDQPAKFTAKVGCWSTSSSCQGLARCQARCQPPAAAATAARHSGSSQGKPHTRVPPPPAPLQKPFHNQSTKIHAALKESLTAIEPHLSFNGTANGFVPGRPVLDVPGWRERYTNTAAAANSNYNAMSRLRIFAGTSNPVSPQSRPAGTTAGSCLHVLPATRSSSSSELGLRNAHPCCSHICVSPTIGEGQLADPEHHLAGAHTRPFVTQVLSAEVASYLGLELGKIKIKRFADGEIYVQVQVSQQ